MSRIQTNPDFFKQVKALEQRISRLERVASTTTLKDVNTSGLTSAQIDAAVFAGTSTPSVGAQAADGLIIRDSTNNLLLVRQNGVWDSHVRVPTVVVRVAIPLSSSFGGGTAQVARKFPDGTVEWMQNLYTTGQPSASSIQVTSGLDSSLVPGNVFNSGWILANYDGAVPYVAYFPNSAPYELWVKTLDGSSRTQWNPIFNSLRYSAISI